MYNYNEVKENTSYEKAIIAIRNAEWSLQVKDYQHFDFYLSLAISAAEDTNEINLFEKIKELQFIRNHGYSNCYSSAYSFLKKGDIQSAFKIYFVDYHGIITDVDKKLINLIEELKNVTNVTLTSSQQNWLYSRICEKYQFQQLRDSFRELSNEIRRG